MAFIDSTYFVGEIAVPNAANDTNLSQAITQYEKEFLISLLGYKTYSLLVADLDEGEPQSQIYIDLIDGAEFTLSYGGESYLLKWNGIRNSDKISPAAYYVYYHFVKRDVSRLYGTGVSMAETKEGWQRVSPVDKLCSVWERMRELYGVISPEYAPLTGDKIKGSDFYEGFNIEPSALNFLITNKDDYPDWLFTPFWNLNKFGI